MDSQTFRTEVELALSHLRDIVRLQSLELVSVLAPGVPRNQRGWELSRRLLEAIGGLLPQQDERDDWPRRRYQILTLRYVNGLSPNEVASRLSMTRRHFYRQLQRALDEFAGFVWSQVSDEPQQIRIAGAQEPAAVAPEADPLELLRRESAPLLSSSQSSSLAEVWQSVLGVLTPLLAEHATSLRGDLSPGLPSVALSPEILKQFLLGLLSDMINWTQRCTIALRAHAVQDGLELIITVLEEPRPDSMEERAAVSAPCDKVGERASAKLAMLHGARAAIMEAMPGGATCRVTLPIVGTRTVLVVEDNEEVCLLFRRYLASGGYQPLVATKGDEAVALARTHDLYAVTLDLMMKGEDGWDVLQVLRHDPQTSRVPIVVCSVLDHQELAQMLGAATYLKKPVMREQLLAALADLKPTIRSRPAGS